ncbi:ATP-binding cassette domain-containing protein [Kribbella endophytica]
MTSSLLEVDGLEVVNSLTGDRLVKGISFGIGPGETVALVGESGSGKSLTARAMIGLLPAGLVATGSASIRSRELLTASERSLRDLRGTGLGMLLQDPFTMLNPLIRVKTLFAETLKAGRPGVRIELPEEIERRLAEVGITDPAVAEKYPWELSGGMRQRIGLAAAIARDPLLLIADEPTTALDVTTQREVLMLLRRIQSARGMGLLLITHDLQIAFSLSDRVLVMSEGELVEQGTTNRLRTNAEHEYTRRLLAAGSSQSSPRTTSPATSTPALLQVRDLRKQFRSRGDRGADSGWALKGIDLDLYDGHSVGVIGESGSGKTTLARCLLGLETPTSGTIDVNGLALHDYARLNPTDLSAARRQVQCVFQDPYSSLNPSHRIGYILAEAIRLRSGRLQRDAVAGEVGRLLADVGLPPTVAKRRPVSLSGGQRQRVAIARALAMRPAILVCDEPVAALDATVQAQVLDVLRGVQAAGVNLLFITHDLSVAREMTDEVVVLHRGEVVERGSTATVLDAPRHDYTRRLVAAIPTGSADWLGDRTTEQEDRA